MFRELNSKHLFGDDTFYKLMPNTLSMIYDTSDKFAPFCDLLCFCYGYVPEQFDAHFFIITSLQWRQMGTMVSLITSLAIVYSSIYFRRRSKEISKLRVTGLCAGNSPWHSFSIMSFSVLCDLVLRESQKYRVVLNDYQSGYHWFCYRNGSLPGKKYGILVSCKWSLLM